MRERVVEVRARVEVTSSSQSLLVSQKTMTRPVAEVKDLITALTVIARSEYCAGMATCRTSVEAWLGLGLGLD